MTTGFKAGVALAILLAVPVGATAATGDRVLNARLRSEIGRDLRESRRGVRRARIAARRAMRRAFAIDRRMMGRSYRATMRDSYRRAWRDSMRAAREARRRFWWN
jgi:hypothetical protein